MARFGARLVRTSTNEHWAGPLATLPGVQNCVQHRKQGFDDGKKVIKYHLLSFGFSNLRLQGAEEPVVELKSGWGSLGSLLGIVGGQLASLKVASTQFLGECFQT